MTAIKKYLYKSNRTQSDTLLAGYGRLYNFHAVNYIHNIANVGWRVPTTADWSNIFDFAGGDSTAGTKLKESGESHWNTGNTGTDNYNVNIRGGGSRLPDGEFTDLKAEGVYWTSSQLNDTMASIILFSSGSASVSVDTANLKVGASVRLIRNATAAELLLSDGTEVSPYIGNDGHYYKAVKLGDYIIIAKNLQETKYRNGSSIQLVQDDTLWSELGDIPSLGDTYKGGYLYYSDYTTRVGNILSEEDIQWTNPANDDLTYEFSWDDAVSVIPAITYNGFSDWTLPTVHQWQSILDSIVPNHPELETWTYWTADEIDQFYAWRVDVAERVFYETIKTGDFPTRARATRQVNIPEVGGQCIYNNDQGNIHDIAGMVTFNGMIVTHNNQYVTLN